jgi:hypothetical protein
LQNPDGWEIVQEKDLQHMADTSTCLLIDASCDVPPSVLAHPQVKLLPVA